MRIYQLPFDVRTELSKKLAKLDEVLTKQNPYWHHQRQGDVVVSTHWALHLGKENYSDCKENHNA